MMNDDDDDDDDDDDLERKNDLHNFSATTVPSLETRQTQRADLGSPPLGQQQTSRLGL